MASAAHERDDMDIWKVLGVYQGTATYIVAAGPEHAWHQYARRFGVEIDDVTGYVLLRVELRLPVQLQGQARDLRLKREAAGFNQLLHGAGEFPRNRHAATLTTGGQDHPGPQPFFNNRPTQPCNTTARVYDGHVAGGWHRSPEGPETMTNTINAAGRTFAVDTADRFAVWWTDSDISGAHWGVVTDSTEPEKGFHVSYTECGSVLSTHDDLGVALAEAASLNPA